MNTNCPKRVIAVCAFTALVVGVTVSAVETPSRPNIVLLIPDDDDYEHFGFMGSEIAHTPTLDRLATAGTLFTTAHCPAPLCRPSLASILSGRLPHQYGIYANYLENRGIGKDTTKTVLQPQVSTDADSSDAKAMGGAITIESLLAEMIDRDAVARFPQPDFRLKQDSSYNRASKTPEKPRPKAEGWFTNHDFNSSDKDRNFIRLEKNEGQEEWVLMEDEGPGAIVRSWMPWRGQTNSSTTSIIRFYLDGASEPAIEPTFRSFGGANCRFSTRGFQGVRLPCLCVPSDEK